MNTKTKVVDIQNMSTMDLKNNTKMAEWTKDVLQELTEKLEQHFETDKTPRE